MNKRLSVFLWNIDFFISGICLMSLVSITVIAVCTRYFFNSPIIWLEEIQFILTVQAAFWGASAAFKKGGHIAIEIFVDSFPKTIRKITEIIIVGIVFFTLFFLVHQQIDRSVTLYVSGRRTQILNFPAFINYAAVSLSCIFMIIHYAIYNYKKFIQKPDFSKEA